MADNAADDQEPDGDGAPSRAEQLTKLKSQLSIRKITRLLYSDDGLWWTIGMILIALGPLFEHYKARLDAVTNKTLQERAAYKAFLATYNGWTQVPVQTLSVMAAPALMKRLQFYESTPVESGKVGAERKNADLVRTLVVCVASQRAWSTAHHHMFLF